MQIKPHRLSIEYSTGIPKHWFGGTVFGSHLLNSFNLLFPGSERYFIRTVKKFTNEIQDTKLLDSIKGFIGQENSHANQHEKFWEVMQSQGYEIDSFLKLFDSISFGFLEKVFPDKLNLAITAGLEHFTAMLADLGLEEDLFSIAHPSMKDLFEWHAAEELDHKSVAFDTLLAIDDGYPLRFVGMLTAVGLLVGFSGAGIVMLVLQDGKFLDARVWFEVIEVLFGKKIGLAEKTILSFFEYFDPSFHPSNKKNHYLAEKVFERLEEKEIANK